MMFGHFIFDGPKGDAAEGNRTSSDGRLKIYHKIIFVCNFRVIEI